MEVAEAENDGPELLLNVIAYMLMKTGQQEIVIERKDIDAMIESHQTGSFVIEQSSNGSIRVRYSSDSFQKTVSDIVQPDTDTKTNVMH